MTPDRTAALSHFLRFLSAAPAVNDMSLRAVSEGALAPVGAEAAVLYLHDGEGSLVKAGSHGLSADELRDFTVLSLALSLPVTRAFNTRQPVFIAADGMVEEFPLWAASRSAMTWAEQAELASRAELVAIPLLWEREPLGVLGVIASKGSDWQPADLPYLEAVSHIVTLWLVGLHGGSSVMTRTRSSRAGMQITDRQREVLQLVRRGMTNPAIGAALGFSVSTVKGDLSAVQRMVGAVDREGTVTRAVELGLIPAEGP